MKNELSRGLDQVIASLRRGDFRSYQVPGEGEQIKKLRQRLKMTQPEFAESLGVSVDTLKSWEIGRRNPGRTAQVKIDALQEALETAES